MLARVLRRQVRISHALALDRVEREAARRARLTGSLIEHFALAVRRGVQVQRERTVGVAAVLDAVQADRVCQRARVNAHRAQDGW